MLEQFGVVVSDFVSKIRDLVATLFELTTDQVELIEYRILDLDAHVRRQSESVLEVIESLLIAELLLQQTRLRRDQRLSRLGHLKLLAGNRVLGRRDDRQLLAQCVFKASQIVSKPSDVFLRISDLQLVLNQSQKAADLRDRTPATKARSPGVVLDVPNGSESTPKASKTLQTRSAEQSPSTRRTRLGLPSYRHRGVKPRAIPFKGSNIIKQRALCKRQSLHDHVPTRTPKKGLDKAEIDQRIGRLRVRTRQLPSQRVGKAHDQIGSCRKLTTQSQTARAA